MKKIMVVLFSFIFLTASCKNESTEIDKTVVTSFDINEYLGTWYEIARLNHKFEKSLVGVTAKYSYSKNGKIKVENSGFKGSLDEEKSYATVKAKNTNSNVPSKLKVSLFMFFYADYLVMELDKNYK